MMDGKKKNRDELTFLIAYAGMFCYVLFVDHAEIPLNIYTGSL